MSADNWTRSECRVANKLLDAASQRIAERLKNKPSTPQEWSEQGPSYLEAQCDQIELQAARLGVTATRLRRCLRESLELGVAL